MDVVKGICDEVAIISDGHLIEQGKRPVLQQCKDPVPGFHPLHHPPGSAPGVSGSDGAEVPGSYPLVKLGFGPGDQCAISEASRRFNIDISILSADIEYAGGVKFGFLLAELFGTRPSARPPSSSSSTTTFSWR